MQGNSWRRWFFQECLGTLDHLSVRYRTVQTIASSFEVSPFSRSGCNYACPLLSQREFQVN